MIGFIDPGTIDILIPKARGRTPISDTRQIRVIVQECFDAAVNDLRKKNLNEDADQLMSATVHWLKHADIRGDKFREGYFF